ncbi:MAG: branched-chain amino acid ABC transporter permease [Chloroflexota bacterium]|nr:MAG: branched-chain amino acid ABC transporter permease [Chloroflexota bacterium]
MQSIQTLPRWRRVLQSNWLYLAVLVFLIIFPHLVGWITGDSPFGVGGRPRGQSVFWQSVFIEVFILTILTMSYNLIFGFTGVISFGHALFFGLGGYILGLVLQMTDLGPEIGLVVGGVIGVIICGLLGFLMGLVSLRLRGVYFAIFTLAIAEMFFIYIGRWPLTNAEDGFALNNIPELLNSTRNRLTYYYVALVLVILTFLFIRRLINSPTGKVLLAIRENENRAQAIGYNTLTFKLVAITLAGMMAAGAGMLHVILNKKVGPETLGLTYTVDPLLMTIIGGVGTHAGPIIGTAGLHLSERVFNREFIIGSTTINIGQNWSLILGIIFIVVVLVFPQGVVGTWARWRQRRRAARAPTESGRSG